MTASVSTAMPFSAPLSRNNKLVLDQLSQSDKPQSAYELLDSLRDEGLRAPPQIYRALKWLGDHGLVHKLESANAYIACVHASCCGGARCASSHTVFFLCDGCGGVEEVNGDALANDVNALGKTLGFAAHTTNIEVHGQCAACQTS
ncbi:MAG: Fur family transcriptional regulator [Hyphomicrobiales bacterium]|jgi:Fur family zinc uptake transcriptional regulator